MASPASRTEIFSFSILYRNAPVKKKVIVRLIPYSLFVNDLLKKSDVQKRRNTNIAAEINKLSLGV